MWRTRSDFGVRPTALTTQPRKDLGIRFRNCRRRALFALRAREGDPPHRRGAAANRWRRPYDGAPGGIAFPEWDFRSGTSRRPGAIVREGAAALGDPEWVTSALAVTRASSGGSAAGSSGCAPGEPVSDGS